MPLELLDNNLCDFRYFRHGGQPISTPPPISTNGSFAITSAATTRPTKKWQAIDRYSDGNGIILDVNQQYGRSPDGFHYIGRTLVQSNLCYDNGGSGIHTVTADHVDIINNTVYLNSASVHLEYGEIFTYGSNDVRIMNNVLVAPVANLAAGEKPEPVNSPGGKNSDVIMAHNIYFGGNIPPVMGEGDMIADPRFVNPSLDDKVADFHLRPDSPALKKGICAFPFFPFLRS